MNDVQVRLEDLLLVVVLLHFARRRLFPQLAGQAAVRAVDDVGVHVADQLLRDGAGPARVAAERVLERSRHAHEIDPVMLIETLILDRNKGLGDIARQRTEGDHLAPLQPDLADERTVARVDL